MTELKIRPATAADAHVLAALAERLASFTLPSWRTPGSIAAADAGAMKEAIDAGSADNQVLIAERAGIPVGCLHILVMTDFFGASHGHISVLSTTVEVEGTGVGRALIAYAEDWTRQRGLSLMTLNVFTGNERARRFYDRSGFEVEMLKYAKNITRGPGDQEVS
jgi:ribosomal protein S18 acetylase RimI-like enzyme